MTISEVAQKHDLSVHTLRYYEKIGLIPSVHRNGGRLRNYTENDCLWINYIKCMRRAGISVEALVEYVALFRKGPETQGLRKQFLIGQRTQIAEKLKDMTEMLAYLDDKISRYDALLDEAGQRLKDEMVL